MPGKKKPTDDDSVGWPMGEFSDPMRVGFFRNVMNENLENQWFYHATANIIIANSLLRSFPEVDIDKIGITGFS